MSPNATRLGVRALLPSVVLASLAGAIVLHHDANASNAGTPANKVVAAGSDTKSMSCSATSTGPGTVTGTVACGQTVLDTATVRSTGSGDYVVTVSAECDILAALDTKSGGNTPSTSSGSASVKIWVAIDGNPVPVRTGQTGPEVGRVTFCDQVHTRSFTSDSSSTEDITTSDETKDANSFTWLALNVGPGVHTVTLWADLEASATNVATATGYVGQRTMVLDPGHAANDATVNP